MRARFGGDGCASLPGQIRIPARRQINALRKDGLVITHVAMQTFFEEKGGNAEPAGLDHPGLNGVVKFGRWIKVVDRANAEITEIFLRELRIKDCIRFGMSVIVYRLL